MLKNDANIQFDTEVIGKIYKDKYEPNGLPDYNERRKVWWLFVATLARQGAITEKQAETWMPPRTCYSAGEWHDHLRAKNKKQEDKK